MKVRYLSILVMLGMLLLAGGAGAAGNSLAADPDPGGVMFVENMGQWDPRVRFQAQGDHGTLWVTNDGLWLSILETAGDAAALEVATEEPGAVQAERPVHGVALKMGFERATPQAVEPYGLVETEMSYFLGNDPAKWVAGAPVWAGVRYVNLYPGIDLELSGKDGRLAPKLVVREGADLGKVRMRVEGGEAMTVESGRMVLQTAIGPVALPGLEMQGASLETLPVVGVEGEEVELRLSVAQEAVQEAEAGESEAAEVAEPLAEEAMAAVTTTFIFSTYLGGTETDAVHSVSADTAKATYGCGQTSSADFPTKTGFYDTTYHGGNDAFVAKYDFNGKLLAVTFVGGSDDDMCAALVVKGTKIYFAGQTFSADFPTTAGAFDTTRDCGGPFSCGDAYVASLATTLKTLSASTYLGGGTDDIAWALDLDSNYNAYVGGSTHGGFPTTVGTAQPAHGGDRDGFVAKLNAGLTALVWATYLGGGSDDGVDGLAVSGTTPYVVGETYSSDFPKTASAYDETYNAGRDAFMTKLKPAGTLAYSSFMGGAGTDQLMDVNVDGSGRAHAVGYTDSTDYPKTANAFQGSLKGSRDAVVTVMNAAGSDLVYSTFYGGTDLEETGEIAIDRYGNDFITGHSHSTDLRTKDAYRATPKGNADAFVAKLQTLGAGSPLPLVYATYLGGSQHDDGYAIGLDTNGYILLGGATTSTDFPKVNAADSTHHGGEDAFVTKLALAPVKTTSFQDGVSPTSSYAGTRDTYVRQASPYTNYGASTLLNVDGDDPNGSGGDVCTLIKWDTTAIPSCSTLTSAKITLYVSNHSSGQVYKAYKVRQSWDEMTVAWSNRPASDTTVLGSIGMGVLGQYTFNLTTSGKGIVQGWIDSPGTNYGIWICNSANTDGFDVASREAATKTNRPRLTVTWVNPSVTTAGSAVEEVIEVPSVRLPGWQDTWLPLVVH